MQRSQFVIFQPHHSPHISPVAAQNLVLPQTRHGNMSWKKNRAVPFDSIAHLHSIYIVRTITYVISREQ